MLHQLFTFPRTQRVWLACSGGSDSMAVASFYKRGNKPYAILHFNHGTPQAKDAEAFVREWADQNDVDVCVGRLTAERPKGLSPEEHWRNERYFWLQSIALGEPLITCHNLGDAVEGYLFSCLHGNPKVIASKRDNIYRPFLTNTKQDLLAWCVQHDVKWIEDKSNADVKTPRNLIRHQILPLCQIVNPGIEKVVKKKILAAAKEAQ